MSKPSARKSRPQPQLAADILSGWRVFALLGLAVLVFYWIPLTSPNASIQWDAVDAHYTPQKYFADRIWSGLPFWTPYVFSGFPFLADPQVGAWYPLNWPFFLAGVTPRGIQLELALHALLACAGAYLLFFRLLGGRAAALAGAVAYGFSGYFAGASSHLGVFASGAWLPWLLLGFSRALESSALRYTALTGLAAGCMVLAGHFQTSLYALAAVALFAVSTVIQEPRRWKRVAGILAGIAVTAVLVSAVQTLPGLELTRHSVRAGFDYSTSTEGTMQLTALATLLVPDFYGALSGNYAGPVDITQFYLYAGLLLVPLAIFGLRNPKTRVPGLLLFVLPLWYSLGPAAGLYRVVAWLPGFRSVRAPVIFWFVPAFGLALLASAGASEVMSRWKHWWLAPAIVLALFCDVLYWNSLANPLAYARASFQDLYGAGQELAEAKLAGKQPPLTRFHAPSKLSAFGPMNHPLDLRLETTYGYNPLLLAAYADYLSAAERNRKLLDGLNVSRVLDTGRAAVEPNPSVLPRAYFPKALASVAGPADSRRRLETLDPSAGSILTGAYPQLHQDTGATAEIVHYDERSYRIHYRASSPSLLRLSVPYYPGWRAAVSGKDCPVAIVDHALMGVVVPPGEQELEVRYRSRPFELGAGISLVALLAAALLAWRGRF